VRPDGEAVEVVKMKTKSKTIPLNRARAAEWSAALVKVERGELDRVKSGGAFEVERVRTAYHGIARHDAAEALIEQAGGTVEAVARSYATTVAVQAFGRWFLVEPERGSVTTTRHCNGFAAVSGAVPLTLNALLSERWSGQPSEVIEVAAGLLASGHFASDAIDTAIAVLR
jgi:hypothetical protein